MSPPNHLDESASTAFESDAAPVLRSLQEALHALIRQPGDRRMRASDLPRSLGITPSLSWQVFRVATSEDVFGEVRQIPRPDAMAKLVSAARSCGYSGRAIEAVEAGYRAFESLVRRHADGRAAFDAMSAGLGRGELERSELPARRAAYRANSQLWGFHARLCYKCMVVSPGAEWRTNPLVIVRGLQGLRALRRVRPIALGRREFVSVGQGREYGRAATEEPGAVLLRDFCSPGLPPIESRPEGTTGHDFLSMSEIGATSEADVFMSARTHCVNHESREIGTCTVMHTPCEEFIADLVVPTGLWDLETLDAGVFACIEDVSKGKTMHQDHRLPCATTAEHLGRSVDALHSSSFTRCPELIRAVLRENHWMATEFEYCRFRIRYPLLHSCIAILVQESRDSAARPDRQQP
ncbi:MAG: hypothetical protein U0638_13900 [Phycisphaerales bacterium]